jgi:excisionase family DNA binding protein
MNKLLTVKDVAEILNFSTSKIYKLIKDNKINYIRIGTDYRFAPEDVAQWLNKNKSKQNIMIGNAKA